MAAQRSRLRDSLGFVSKVGDRLTQTYRLARALPEFFRERITVQQAEEEIKRMLASREERFLELARSRIYGNPASPYLRLLKIAGCEFADLQAHVHRDGLETTLKKLASDGVYLTADEFKGKKAVARGRESFHVSPEDFQRPDSPPGYAGQSSGTRNRPVRSLRPLDWLALRTFGLCIFFSAHNLFSYSHAVYEAILPGTGGVGRLLHYAKLGIRIDRWFARRVPATGWLERSHHYLNTYLIVGMGKLYGPGVPRPEFIDPEDTQRIVYWISEQQRAGHACCVATVSSSAARIARMAWKMGASLEGTVFDITGEPFTEAKERTIKQVGAFVTSRYAYGGGIPAGYGCASPVEKDEVHVNQYILAMIPHPRPLNDHDVKIQPLLLTTLHLAAPTLLLNVENGDYATFLRRDCGCALGRVGLKLHLHHIRSYEKFTSEGMNYFYGDLYELFEKKLPSEFGGGPGDYQLVEEEDENGQTRITLRVHPEAGEIDQEKLGSRLREAMGRGSWGNEFQARVWDDAGTLRIKREAPFASARGKILPLQIKKSQ